MLGSEPLRYKPPNTLNQPINFVLTPKLKKPSAGLGLGSIACKQTAIRRCTLSFRMHGGLLGRTAGCLHNLGQACQTGYEYHRLFLGCR